MLTLCSYVMPEKEYWELNVKTVKLSRSGDGSFGISIEGGADKGKFLAQLFNNYRGFRFILGGLNESP